MISKLTVLGNGICILLDHSVFFFYSVSTENKLWILWKQEEIRMHNPTLNESFILKIDKVTN
jgi:hypothetical protein